MTPARAVLGGSRLLAGLAGWFAPRPFSRALGIDPDRTDRWVTRLFGSRDLVLGAAQLVVPPPAVAPLVTVGVVVDSLDALSGWRERRRGSIGRWTVVAGPVGAAAFAALGAYVLVQGREAVRR